MPKPKNLNKGHDHNMQTPAYALWPLYQHMRVTQRIWEPAMGKGYLVDELAQRGYPVVGSDLLAGQDFFHYEPDIPWDVQVTNPPFDIKTPWLQRSYQLGKPFALLLPLVALETEDRQSLYREHGLEIIVMNRRVLFETPDQTSSAWFPTAWFTHGLNIGKDISYYVYSDAEWRQTSKAWKSYLKDNGKLKPAKQKKRNRD